MPLQRVGHIHLFEASNNLKSIVHLLYTKHGCSEFLILPSSAAACRLSTPKFLMEQGATHHKSMVHALKRNQLPLLAVVQRNQGIEVRPQFKCLLRDPAWTTASFAVVSDSKPFAQSSPSQRNELTVYCSQIENGTFSPGIITLHYTMRNQASPQHLLYLLNLIPFRISQTSAEHKDRILPYIFGIPQGVLASHVQYQQAPLTPEIEP